MSADLVAFLRARCDADELSAPEVHAASCPAVHATGMLYAVDPDSCTCGWPEHLLADVAAKRAILDLHDQSGQRWTGFPRADRQENYCTHDQHPAPCPTVLALAQSYAGRDGFREEWQA